jgi:hypothetical protein
MLKELFTRHVARRGLIESRRQRAGARYRMLGETLERRSMLAVSASLSAGTLSIVCNAANDAAFLSITGTKYAVTDGSGKAVSGSPFSGVTAAVSVTGTAAANQSFTFGGSTALPVSLSVDGSMEAASISQTIAAAALANSTVSIYSPVTIILAADISTAGSQTYAGPVLLASSPSLKSTESAVNFQSEVGVGFTTQKSFATGNNPASVAIGDFNGDGKPDLAIANYGSNSVSVLLNMTAAGAGTPSYGTQATFATGSGPVSVATGDFNGDGKPDLAIANQVSESVSVLLNTTAPGATTPKYAAQTTFATGPGNQQYSVAIGDINGDGKPDLALATRRGGSVLLNNTALGATTPSYRAQAPLATYGMFPRSVALSDLNADGKPDLAITHSYYVSDSLANVPLSVFTTQLNTTGTNATTPSYADPVRYFVAFRDQAGQISIGDLNGDGKPDLATANRESSTVTIPAAAQTASCVTVAEWAFQITPGRGTRCFSRLSVCSSTRPGKSQSPFQSSALLADVEPRSIERMIPPSTTIQPVNSSVGVTIFAFLMMRCFMRFLA